MTIDPRLIGGGAALLAAVLTVYMPVSKRRVNQTVIAVVLAILIFIAAFAFLDPPYALIAGAAITLVVLGARFLMGTFRTVLYHNITRYTRRDFWQRKVGQAVLGGGRRRRR